MLNTQSLAIIGAGNIGTAIAVGLVESGRFSKDRLFLTRRKADLTEPQDEEGFLIGHDNLHAVRNADLVLIAVEPQQIDGVLHEIKSELVQGRHLLMSVVSNVRIRQIKSIIGAQHTVVRVMPNTAAAIRDSMTCLAAGDEDCKGLETAESIFGTLGSTLVIDEEQMTAATALCACGIAFFLRAIRAASQGGIEIGFHAEDALLIAAQTARGAASLVLNMENHPEYEIDRVTTPRGCTISGLNRMEHAGFSSALIKGITTSAEKAAGLYQSKNRSDEEKDRTGS
ncbi:MAG TPA: pyrroline-5-carboxylate reductase [bacterium]|nr:pyrroline-5-carboxylate reductase [bacterium]